MKWEEGGTFRRDHKVSRFSDAKYYDAVKKDIMNRIEDIKGTAITSMCDFAAEVINSYRTQLNGNIKNKKVELQKIEADHRKNDEIIKWLQGKGQFLIKIDNNKNDLRDYEIMINDVLKLSKN